jgi:hypothetical protein
LPTYGHEDHDEENENVETDGDEAINEDYGLTIILDQRPTELVHSYRNLIKKVRKVVKIFKNSPTKNDIYLQKYILEEHGKNLKLILDCQTRWNSLLDMLERFYSLRLCIRKALLDIASEICFTDEEWSQINDLIFCLEPLKIGLEVLCRRESNLITAETTFRFMLDKLEQQSSTLSIGLAKALRERLTARRSNLTDMLIYLQNPKKYDELRKTGNIILKKTAMRQEIKKLLKRVYKIEENETEDEESKDESQQPNNLSLKEELENQIQNEKKNCIKVVKNVPDTDSFEKILKKEMSAYESDGVRDKFLSMTYNYLMTISPTSVEAERAFSAAGYICSPLRSRLGDDTLSSVCLLRSYFLQ